MLCQEAAVRCRDHDVVVAIRDQRGLRDAAEPMQTGGIGDAPRSDGVHLGVACGEADRRVSMLRGSSHPRPAALTILMSMQKSARSRTGPIAAGDLACSMQASLCRRLFAPFGEPLGKLAGETTVAWTTTADLQVDREATTGIEPV